MAGEDETASMRGAGRTPDPGAAVAVESSDHFGTRCAVAPPIPHKIADGDSPDAASSTDLPIKWSELLGVLLLIVLADATIYHGRGFAGYALLFAAAPILLWVASPRKYTTAAFWITGAMLLVLAARLVWSGSVPVVALGFAWLVAFSMALAGFRPYVPEVCVFAGQTLQAGLLGLIRYG
jgi:hypothetical protein